MFKEMGAIMNLLGNKGKLQEEMGRFQAQVQTMKAEGSAGGGLVVVSVSGKFEMLSCKITDDALKQNDRELLEDLIVAATNQAISKFRDQLAEETNRVATTMGIPPGMLGGGLPGLG